MRAAQCQCSLSTNEHWRPESEPDQSENRATRHEQSENYIIIIIIIIIINSILIKIIMMTFTSLLASLCGKLTLSASTDSAGESVEAYLRSIHPYPYL